MASERLPRAAVIFLAANVLFGSGLFFHAFLYNFYLDKLGFSPTIMGHAAAALTTGGLLGLLPAGWLVDRIGIRWGLLSAGVVCAAGLAAGALTTSPAAIYLAAGLAGAANATWRVAQAPTLMKLAPTGQRSRLFAWNVALIIGSGAVGVAIAGAVPGWFERMLHVEPLVALRLALALGAACTALSMALYAMLRVGAGDPDITTRPAAHAQRGLPGGIIGTIALIGLWMVGPALVAPFFNIYFFKHFNFPVDRVGLIFALASGGCALVVVGSGEVASRLELPRLVTAWLLLLGPVLLLLPLAGPVGAIGLFLVQGLPQPAANPLIDQILMESVPPERRGSLSSWRNVAADVSAIAGASAGGWVLARASFPALFVAAGLVGLVAAVPLSLGLRSLHARRVDEPAVPA